MKFMKKALALFIALIMTLSVVPAFAEDSSNGKTIDLSVAFSSDNKGVTPITSVTAGETFYMHINFAGNPTDGTGIVAYTVLFSYNQDKITINRNLNSLTTPIFNASFTDDVFLATWVSEEGIVNEDSEPVSEGALFRVEATALTDLAEDDLARIEPIESTVDSDGVMVKTSISDVDDGKFVINWVPALEKEEPAGPTIDLAIEFSEESMRANSVTSVAAGETFTMWVTFAGNPTELAESIQAYDLLIGYDAAKVSFPYGTGSAIQGLTKPTFNPAFADGVMYAGWASDSGIVVVRDVQASGLLFQIDAKATTALTAEDLAEIKFIKNATSADGKKQTTQLLNGSKVAFNYVQVPTIVEEPELTEIKETDFTFDLADRVYTGSAIEPAVISTLIAGTDYEVAYADNVNVGTATITVTGKGNYTGTITKTFKIIAKEVTDDRTIDISIVFSSDNKGANPITSVAAGETFYMLVNFAGNPTDGTGIVAYAVLFSYNQDKITINRKLNSLTTPTFNPAFADGVFLGAWGSLDGIVNEDDEIASDGFLFRVEATALADLTADDLKSIELLESATDSAQDNTQESEFVDINNDKFTINWVPALEKEDPVYITWEDFDFSEFYPDYVFQYTGSAIEPAVISDTLVEGRDYTVTYRDNLYAGTARVIINGIGDYAGGTIEVHFTIVPASICEADFALAETSYVYTGCSINPGIITMLAHGIDFEVCYENNVDVGIARVAITGIGNYVGQVYFDYEILPKEITDADFALDRSDFVYTGSAIEPEVISVIGLVEYWDYEVCYLNNVNVGTATIAVAGKGNYTGTIVKTFTIRPVYATEADFVFGEPEEWYEAKIQAMELERGIEIEVTSAPGLVEGEDYEVVYTNNHAAGVATVIVRGIGNYTGEVSKTFEIRTYRLGDVDDDGSWNTLDAIRILKMATCLYTNYSEREAKAAEVRADGMINAIDALEVLRYSALLDGTISRFYGECF